MQGVEGGGAGSGVVVLVQGVVWEEVQGVVVVKVQGVMWVEVQGVVWWCRVQGVVCMVWCGGAGAGRGVQEQDDPAAGRPKTIKEMEEEKQAEKEAQQK